MWEGQHIEGVKCIGDIGEGECEEMGLANIEILKHNFIRFADEGGTLENFGSDFLNFGHVISMGLPGEIKVSLLFFCKGARVDDFVAIFIVLGECL